MTQFPTLQVPYPADQIPNGIEILFNGHNVDCWCIIDGKKAELDYYLSQGNDAVIVSPERLKFVDVYFDKQFVLTVNSNGVATQNNLTKFTQNQPWFFHDNQKHFSQAIPKLILDWELQSNIQKKWKDYQNRAAKIAEGYIPF